MSQRNLQEERRKNYQESGGGRGGQVGQHKNKGFSYETHLSTRYNVPRVLPLDSYTSDEKGSLLPFTEMKSKLVPFGFNVPSRVSEHKQ